MAVEIYNKKFDEEISGVICGVKKENMKYNKPNSVELAKIVKIVEEFIAKRGLKLYGGHALNHFLPVANKIYKDGVDINDYDLYCVNAEKEGKDLADKLYKAGIEYVSLGVGGFGDNYKLFCSFEEIANFTGLPKKLFDVVPAKRDGKSGVLYVEPDYLKMDLRVSLVNPRISLWRWVKDYKRKELLDKSYPFKKPDNCKWPVLSNGDKVLVGELAKFVAEWGKSGNGGVVYTGFNAMHMFYSQSGVGVGNKVSLGAPKQIMTEVMVEDIKSLISRIVMKFGKGGKGKNENGNGGAGGFSYVTEEDPLHILPKRFVVRSSKSGRDLLVVYSLAENCVPYVVLRGTKCVSADYLMLYFQVNMYHAMMRKGVRGKKVGSEMVGLYKCALFGFEELRDKYLANKGKTVFDDTMFKQHIIRCFGNFVNPYYQTKLLRWEKKAKGGTYVPAKADV